MCVRVGMCVCVCDENKKKLLLLGSRNLNTLMEDVKNIATYRFYIHVVGCLRRYR